MCAFLTEFSCKQLAIKLRVHPVIGGISLQQHLLLVQLGLYSLVGHDWYILGPQILKGDPTIFIPLRVMASSAMKLQLGIFGLLITTHVKTSLCKQNTSTIFMHHVAFHVSLSSRSDHSTYAPEKSQLLWSWEILNTVMKVRWCYYIDQMGKSSFGLFVSTRIF